MIAQQCDLEVGDFVWTGGDVHIYQNHIDQVNLQLTRQPFSLPSLVIKRKPSTLFDYEFEDFEVVNYQYHPGIKEYILGHDMERQKLRFGNTGRFNQ